MKESNVLSWLAQGLSGPRHSVHRQSSCHTQMGACGSVGQAVFSYDFVMTYTMKWSSFQQNEESFFLYLFHYFPSQEVDSRVAYFLAFLFELGFCYRRTFSLEFIQRFLSMSMFQPIARGSGFSLFFPTNQTGQIITNGVYIGLTKQLKADFLASTSIQCFFFFFK